MPLFSEEQKWGRPGNKAINTLSLNPELMLTLLLHIPTHHTPHIHIPPITKCTTKRSPRMNQK